jgi:hypothetical protein
VATPSSLVLLRMITHSILVSLGVIPMILFTYFADCTIRFRPVFALSMVLVYACCSLIQVGPTLTGNTGEVSLTIVQLTRP